MLNLGRNIFTNYHSSTPVKFFVQQYSTIISPELVVNALKKRSIISTIDSVEKLTSLNPKKYSKFRWRQLQEVSQDLDKKIRIVSYNILWDLFEKNTAEEYKWKNRIERVIETVTDGYPDIIGLQEDRSHMIDEVYPFLQDTYVRVGEAGTCDECCSLLINKERFELLCTTNTSLSNMKYRHLTGVRIFDRVTKKTLKVYNTHLSYSCLDSRQDQAYNLGKHLERVIDSSGKRDRVILVGDLNTFCNRPDSFTNMPLDGDEIVGYIEQSGMINTMKSALFGCVGPKSSYTNDEQAHKIEKKCIPFTGLGVPGVYLDHIYTCNKTTVLIHAVNSVLINGLFASDHMPIIADIIP